MPSFLEVEHKLLNQLFLLQFERIPLKNPNNNLDWREIVVGGQGFISVVWSNKSATTCFNGYWHDQDFDLIT